MTHDPDTLYARLLFFLNEHRDALDGDNHTEQFLVIERLRCVLQTEARAIHAIIQHEQLSDVPCCECGSRVLNQPDYLRLKLCTMCMCSGLLARCVHCGENAPEHHPGGRGCQAWQRRELTVAEEQEQW